MGARKSLSGWQTRPTTSLVGSAPRPPARAIAAHSRGYQVEPFGYAAFVLFGLPSRDEVRALAKKNPAVTGVMRQREDEGEWPRARYLAALREALEFYPNVDFYSGLIYQAMGFPVDMFPVLFAIPRMSGWLAQWEELLTDKEQKIARPRPLYLGAGERPFVPMEQRH